VVVGVEPLGHLDGVLAAVAARQLEVLRAGKRGRIEAEAARDGADQHLCVEHVVVQREVADRADVEAGAFLQQPVLLAQFARAGLQCGVIDVVFPELLDQEFQFARRRCGKPAR
jgi:hypothetical protein